jgi:hypothetical protein
MNPTYDKASIELPASWKAKTPIFLLAGLACIGLGAICFMIAPSSGPDKSLAFKYFVHSYLANFMYILTPALGALFFILVQFLTRAGWSTSIRRLAEIMMAMIPYLAMLFVPIIGLLYWNNNSDLYGWNAKEPENSVVAAKAAEYLYREFFTVRSAVYFAIWIFAGTWYFRLSRAQDESGDTELSLVRQKWAGPLIMLFALSMSFAAFDWVMSIDADWYSTIFGVYLFAGSMLGFFATMVALSMSLQNAGKLEKWVTVEHFHDMGKFMFGFTMFWSYIAFSQLVLIWYANVPEETYWYDIRITTNWKYLSYGLIALHFAIPFLGLLSRHVRRHRLGLLFWSIWILVAHWLDLTFLVLPNVANPEGALLFPMLGHLLGGIGMVCIFVALFLVRATGVPLVAVRDPRLHEAMSYANPIL